MKIGVIVFFPNQSDWPRFLTMEHARARLPTAAFTAHALQSIVEHVAHFAMRTGTGCQSNIALLAHD